MNNGVYGLTTTDGKNPARPWATVAQARDGINSTTVISPSGAQIAILNWNTLVLGAANGASGGTWTGLGGPAMNAISGATANGSTQIYASSPTSAMFLSPNSAGIDWSTPKAMWCRIFTQSSTTNGITRAHFGFNPTTYAAGGHVLSVRGIGWELRGSTNRVWIVAHNGTSLTEYDTGTTIANVVYADMLIYSDGIGNVTLYRNGVAVGTTSGGPVSQGSNIPNVRYEVINGGDSSSVVMAFNQPRVTIG